MKIVVTAGPTREYIDPVRFLSNPSTGKMGFQIAAAAARRGHEVILVAGPVNLKTPKGVTRVDITSARDMLQAVEKAISPSASDKVVLISSAAVADWRPAECATSKLKKHEMSGVFRLVRNPDILKSVTGCVKVGFAAETDSVLKEAARKCREKGLAFIVANDVSEAGSGFGVDTNRVTFVFPDGETKPLPLMSKRRVAGAIVREVEKL